MQFWLWWCNVVFVMLMCTALRLSTFRHYVSLAFYQQDHAGPVEPLTGHIWTASTAACRMPAQGACPLLPV